MDVFIFQRSGPEYVIDGNDILRASMLHARTEKRNLSTQIRLPGFRLRNTTSRCLVKRAPFVTANKRESKERKLPQSTNNSYTKQQGLDCVRGITYQLVLVQQLRSTNTSVKF
jgi:hypothetical protein